MKHFSYLLYISLSLFQNISTRVLFIAHNIFLIVDRVLRLQFFLCVYDMGSAKNWLACMLCKSNNCEINV